MNTFIVQMLQMLLNNGKVELHGIMEQLCLTKRMVLYYQKMLNDFLCSEGLGETQIRDETLHLEHSDLQSIKNLLENMDLSQYHLESKERQECILLKIGVSADPQHLEDFADEFRVSRRTLTNDMLILKEYLQGYGVGLTGRQRQGYCFEGDELTIRYLLMSAYHHRENICIDRIKKQILLDAYNRYCTKEPVKNIFEKIRKILVESEDYSREKFVFFALPDLAQTILLVYLRGKKQPLCFDRRDMDLQIFGGMEHIKREFSRHHIDLGERELQYLGFVLQSAKISNYENGAHETIVMKLAEDITEEFRHACGLNLFHSAELFEMFVLHVRSMYYRTKYRIKITNFYRQPAEMDRAFLYLTRQIMDKISEKYGLFVDDEELQLISYYFFCMGKQNEPTADDGREKIVIVCVSGLGSSVYIRYQLSRLLEHSFSLVISDLRNLDKVLDDDTRLIVSTLNIDPKYTKGIQSIQVSAVLTQENKRNLIDWLLHEEVCLKNHATVSDVLKIIKNHAVIRDQEKLFLRLNKYFRTEPSLEKEFGISDLVRPEFIRICDGATDWKEGLRKAAEPLLLQGWIQESYVEDTLAVIEEHGPYCEFLNGMLLAHAAPKNNVEKPAISVAVFRTPIAVESWRKELTAIFVLGVVDQFSHASALSELVVNLSRQEKYKMLHLSESIDKIYHILMDDI